MIVVIADTNTEAVCMLKKDPDADSNRNKRYSLIHSDLSTLELIAECVLHTMLFLYFIFSYIINN